MGDVPGLVVTDGLAQTLPAFVADVLGSRCFERAPTLRALLLYLWQHRSEPISEYAVATEALGRGASFNSKIDATVRVQISRLRQRLDKYYEEEGRHCSERLQIPLGSHQIEVQTTELALVPQMPEVLVAPRQQLTSRVLVRSLAIACLVMAAAAVILGIQLYKAGQAVPARPQVARFWKTLFSNRNPTRIILPTPVFFSFASPARPQSSVMLRDTEVNRFDEALAAESIGDLLRRYGKPSLSQSYTVTSDSFASVRLARYLDKLGFDTNVMSSASAPLDALDRENVIAIGTWGTLAPLQPYLDKMSFELFGHEMTAINRTPLAGEPAKFEFKRESNERSVWPGVIALLPGRDGHARLLILASRHTSALVSFLTSREGQDQLDRLWKAKGSPEFYDLVVESEMNSDTLVRFNAAALHPFKP